MIDRGVFTGWSPYGVVPLRRERHLVSEANDQERHTTTTGALRAFSTAPPCRYRQRPSATRPGSSAAPPVHRIPLPTVPTRSCRPPRCWSRIGDGWPARTGSGCDRRGAHRWPAGRERQRFRAGIRRGLSSEDAAVAADVSHPVGTRWFPEGGGMPPVTRAPLPGRFLLFAEREEIAILHARDCGVRETARRTNRAPSTISRKLRRNAATRGGAVEIRASTAQWHAGRRARRPETAKLAANDPLKARHSNGRLRPQRSKGTYTPCQQGGVATTPGAQACPPGSPARNCRRFCPGP